MSILINGMEMPASCWVCSFCRHFDEPNQGFFCLILEEKVDYESSSLYTKDNCPLIPVPNHGRLIDADKIPFLESEDGCQDDYAFRYDINEMPTIIPAEEEIAE